MKCCELLLIQEVFFFNLYSFQIKIHKNQGIRVAKESKLTARVVPFGDERDFQTRVASLAHVLNYFQFSFLFSLYFIHSYYRTNNINFVFHSIGTIATVVRQRLALHHSPLDSLESNVFGCVCTPHAGR